MLAQAALHHACPRRSKGTGREDGPSCLRRRGADAAFATTTVLVWASRRTLWFDSVLRSSDCDSNSCFPVFDGTVLLMQAVPAQLAWPNESHGIDEAEETRCLANKLSIRFRTRRTCVRQLDISWPQTYHFMNQHRIYLHRSLHNFIVLVLSMVKAERLDASFDCNKSIRILSHRVGIGGSDCAYIARRR